MTPVFVAVESFVPITTNKLVKYLFREAGERVNFFIVLPPGVVALTGLPGYSRPPEVGGLVPVPVCVLGTRSGSNLTRSPGRRTSRSRRALIASQSKSEISDEWLGISSSGALPKYYYRASI